MNKNQHGIKSDHSTYMALVVMPENITNVLDNGEYAIGIFLDLQKAFDNVDHNILWNKFIVMVSEELPWNGLKITCKIDIDLLNMLTMKQEPRTIACTVQQWSILCPYLVYINHSHMLSSLFVAISFADDTNLFWTTDNLDILFN